VKACCRKADSIVPLLLVATVWYIILTSVVSVAQFYVERYFARGASRTMAQTPLQMIRANLLTLGGRRRR